MAMLDTVKLALRRANTTAFDAEIALLIEAACKDLGLAGVTEGDLAVAADTTDPLLTQAICTYCKMNFGETDEYEHLKASYDEQKAQLSMATGYTNYDAYGITNALGG